MNANATVCLCGEAQFEPVFRYDAPPTGEGRFELGAARPYRREIVRCRRCGHFVSVHDIDMSALYSGGYVDATYGDGGIGRAFDRIMGLDESKSDNVGRVRRILQFAAGYWPRRSTELSAPSVLDVGSGLCVFLARLKVEAGWRCTALDPDPRSAAHARDTVGVNSICGDFMTSAELGRYDVVTFNKVLEHVRDPVAMLARGGRCLNSGGFAYVELPDGEAAQAEGPGREEFFIDHHHVFSMQSVIILAQQAGFRVLVIERLREPSTKFTLRAFLVQEPVSRVGG